MVFIQKTKEASSEKNVLNCLVKFKVITGKAVKVNSNCKHNTRGYSGGQAAIIS